MLTQSENIQKTALSFIHFTVKPELEREHDFVYLNGFLNEACRLTKRITVIHTGTKIQLL